MSRKIRSKQPYLAAANMPFTPMIHKVEKPAETPFHPLQLNDLATPKVNKSDLSVEKEIVHTNKQYEEFSALKDDEIIHEQKMERRIEERTDKSGNSDIKDLKMALLNCLKVVERMEKKKEAPKVYKSIETQTSKPLISNNKFPQRKPFQNIENQQFNQIEAEQNKPKNKVSGDLNANKSDINTTHSSDESDLNNQINSLSLMLKKLQNRIDQIENPAQK